MGILSAPKKSAVKLAQIIFDKCYSNICGQASSHCAFDGSIQKPREESEHASARLGFEKRLHVSVFQRELADKYAAQGGTTRPTWSAGERLASPPTRTLPEPFSLCDLSASRC
jgi:hypothetical protein